MPESALLDPQETASIDESEADLRKKRSGAYDMIALATAVLYTGTPWEDFYTAFQSLPAGEKQKLRSAMWPGQLRSICS